MNWWGIVGSCHRRRRRRFQESGRAGVRARATGGRYVAEGVDLLAGLAPTLADAIRTASTKAFVLLDGTLLPIDRIAADRPFC